MKFFISRKNTILCLGDKVRYKDDFWSNTNLFPSFSDSSVDVLKVRFPRKFLQVIWGHSAGKVSWLLIFLEIYFSTWSPFYNTFRDAYMYFKRQNSNPSEGGVSLGASQLNVAKLGLWRPRHQSQKGWYFADSGLFLTLFFFGWRGEILDLSIFHLTAVASEAEGKPIVTMNLLCSHAKLGSRELWANA